MAFLPRAAELLAPGGFLVGLDFGDLGRSNEISGLERWYGEVFQKAYSRPLARDPKVTREQAESGPGSGMAGRRARAPVRGEGAAGGVRRLHPGAPKALTGAALDLRTRRS